LFHARGPAAAKDRSPSDDVVRGTATVLDAADLRPGLTVAAVDGVIMSLSETIFPRLRNDLYCVQGTLNSSIPYHHQKK